jgi:hypothetical protein
VSQAPAAGADAWLGQLRAVDGIFSTGLGPARPLKVAASSQYRARERYEAEQITVRYRQRHCRKRHDYQPNEGVLRPECLHGAAELPVEEHRHQQEENHLPGRDGRECGDESCDDSGDEVIQHHLHQRPSSPTAALAIMVYGE